MYVLTILILILLIFVVLWIKSYMQKRDTFNESETYGRDTFEHPVVEQDTNTPKDSQCVCAFDIDYTITCGNPKPFVDKCIEHGCKLAINTARPVKYIGDVDLEEINFKHPHFNEGDFYYNPSSYSQTPTGVGIVKSSYLDVLKNKYTIKDKKCVILLDDATENIKIAQENGFSTIKAKPTHKNSPMCGLNPIDITHLNNILYQCNN